MSDPTSDPLTGRDVAGPLPPEGSASPVSAPLAASGAEPVRRPTVDVVRDVLRRDQPTDEPRPVPDYVRQVSWFLDDAIPLGSRWRIGADGLLSFIPGVGDATGFALSTVVVLSGAKAGVSTPTLIRMIVNAVAESLAGMIPILGPLISLGWKSNKRNLALIEADLADRKATRRSSMQVLAVAAIMVVVFVALLVLSVTLLVLGTWKLISGWLGW